MISLIFALALAVSTAAHDLSTEEKARISFTVRSEDSHADSSSNSGAISPFLHPAKTLIEPGYKDPSESSVGEPISNGCIDMDQDLFTTGMLCGSPLSPPCFDHSRCLPPPEGAGPTVYVHDPECSLADSSNMSTAAINPKQDKDNLGGAWRAAAQEMGVLAETYDSACVFIHVNPRSKHPCVLDTPLWNNGVNHLLVDFSDVSRAERPVVAASFAMEAASNMHTCYYRSGYDMSFPLFPHNVFPEVATTLPEDRRFFLTVKASLYLYGHGSEERMSLVPLHDEANGVIMALHCFEMHHEHLFPENLDYCQWLRERYDVYDYASVMNTTFGIVPAGRSPGSFRLPEVMSAGAIPVFVGRDLVPPFREQFDWESFSFMFSPDDVGPAMIKTLQSVPPEELRVMQQKSLDAYWKIFGGKTNSFESIARKVVDLLIRRISYS